MKIEQKIAQLTDRFNQFSSWEDRYREIIKIGKNLSSIDDSLKQEKFRVKGCQSQVWLVPELRDGKVYFQADSDAMLVKGIVALLVEIYSGEKADDILSNKPDFLSEIGITDHLSMNRSNGLASMIKQIQMYALVYQAQGKLG